MRLSPLQPSLRHARSESGQTTVEYILILGVIVSLFVLMARGLRESGVFEMLGSSLLKEYKAAYEYGHPKAKGFDDGPEKHPRIPDGDNARLFINPDVGG